MTARKYVRPNPPVRAPGQTTLTISLPETLKKQVMRVAELDNRTASNWFCTYVQDLVNRQLANYEATGSITKR